VQQERKRRRHQNFIYDTVFIFKRKDRKKLKKRFVSLRLVKLYYVILKYRHFRNIASLAGRKDGFFQSNFCYRLEGRLCSIVYRTNLVTSMFSAIHFVKTANVLVNKRLITRANFLVKIGDIISFLEDHYIFFRFNLFSRLR